MKVGSRSSLFQDSYCRYVGSPSSLFQDSWYAFCTTTHLFFTSNFIFTIHLLLSFSCEKNSTNLRPSDKLLIDFPFQNLQYILSKTVLQLHKLHEMVHSNLWTYSFFLSWISTYLVQNFQLCSVSKSCYKYQTVLTKCYHNFLLKSSLIFKQNENYTHRLITKWNIILRLTLF